MSRILNIISQIIHIAKKARQQLSEGKKSSTIRLLNIILKLDKKQFKFIKNESGSKRLRKECLEIFNLTEEAILYLKQNNLTKAKQLLDRIIQLEEIEIENPVREKEGLEEEILSAIDPYIRELVQEINKLSFVKKTDDSCSGHFPKRIGAYISINYDWKSRSKHNIVPFHKEIARIPGVRMQILKSFFHTFRIKKVAYFLFLHYGPHEEIWTSERFRRENPKEDIVKRWNQFANIVRKYRDYDTLEFRRRKRYVDKDKSLLDEK